MISNISKSSIILTIAALFFSACNSESKFENTQEVITLETGVPQEVFRGDEIINNEDNTTIRLSHTYGSDKKMVTLLTGSATLIKGNYEVTN